jgi:hypothetical protein
MSDRLIRAIDARTKPRFIEISREKRSGVPFTEEQLTAMRGGLTAEADPRVGREVNRSLALRKHLLVRGRRVVEGEGLHNFPTV